MGSRNNLLFAVLSAVLGVALAATFSAFDEGGVFRWVALSILALGLLVVLAFVGPVRNLLRSSGGIDPSGENWTSRFEFCKDGRMVRIRDEMVLSQIGRHLRGSATSTRIDGPFPEESTSYKLVGTVYPSRRIEGMWRATKQSRDYHGVFLGTVHNAGNRVEVDWLGISSGSNHTGIWVWNRGPVEEDAEIHVGERKT